MATRKRPIDTSKMKVVDRFKDKSSIRITFLDRVEDKKDCEVEHTVYQITWLNDQGKPEGELHQHRQKSVKQKFLCIGGPHAGTRQARPGDDYHTFNVAGHDRKLPRCVWIHKSVLRMPA